jgi:hypothetical protein
MRTFKKLYSLEIPSSYILIHQFTVCSLHCLERIKKAMKYPIIFFHRCINSLFDRTKPVVFKTSYVVKKGNIFISSQTFLIIKSNLYYLFILIFPLTIEIRFGKHLKLYAKHESYSHKCFSRNQWWTGEKYNNTLD